MQRRVIYKVVAEISTDGLADIRLDYQECIGDNLVKIPDTFLIDNNTIANSVSLSLRELLLIRGDIHERVIRGCVKSVTDVVNKLGG